MEDEYLDPITLQNFKLSTILRDNIYLGNETTPIDLNSDLENMGSKNLTVEGLDNSNFAVRDSVKNLKVDIKKDTVVLSDN